jgi:hypothetical protein
MNEAMTMEKIEYATAEDLLGDAINAGKIHHTIGDEWAYWINKYGDWQTGLWKATVFYLEVFLEEHPMFKDCCIDYNFKLDGPEMAGAISNVMPALVLER